MHRGEVVVPQNTLSTIVTSWIHAARSTHMCSAQRRGDWLHGKNDTDADGSDEFWKWANKEEEPRSHDSSDVYSRVRARFNEHDDGNDGLLHMSEFVSFFEGLKMG